MQSGERNSFMPLHIIWISVHKLHKAQCSIIRKTTVWTLTTVTTQICISWDLRSFVIYAAGTVVLHRHFRTTYWCHLQGSSSPRLLDPLRWDPYVVPEHRYETTILCCIKPQKSADFIYTVMEAWIHALYYFLLNTQLYSTLVANLQHYWALTCMGDTGCF